MAKFQKSQAFEKIKAKLGASRQLSERTINDTLETLMTFAGEETELDAFVDQVSGTFISMDGNLRHEVAEKARLLKEAEPKPKTAEELAAEKAAADAKAKAELEEPAWAKANRIAQEERFAAMEAKLTGAEQAKTIAQKKEAILASSKSKYAENVVSVAAKNFDFSKEGADSEFEATCTEIGNMFGVVPAASTGGSDVQPDWEAIKKAHKIK